MQLITLIVPDTYNRLHSAVCLSLSALYWTFSVQRYIVVHWPHSNNTPHLLALHFIFWQQTEQYCCNIFKKSFTTLIRVESKSRDESNLVRELFWLQDGESTHMMTAFSYPPSKYPLLSTLVRTKRSKDSICLPISERSMLYEFPKNVQSGQSLRNARDSSRNAWHSKIRAPTMHRAHGLWSASGSRTADGVMFCFSQQKSIYMYVALPCVTHNTPHITSWKFSSLLREEGCAERLCLPLGWRKREIRMARVVWGQRSEL